MSTTMLTRGLLAGSWTTLGRATNGELRSLPVPEYPSTGLKIAVDNDQSRHLLVPTLLKVRGWSDIGSPLRDAVRSLSFGGHGEHYLDVKCSDPNLYELFDELVISVLGKADLSTDPGASVESSLDEWRTMFRAAALVGFGRAQRFGLFGELLALRHRVKATAPSSITGWTGPYGSAHDFELPGACVEIKAAAASSDAVTIHGLQQLTPHEDRDLLLVVYVIAESEEGTTIRELIAEIESYTAPGALDSALSAVGFSQATPDERLSVVDGFVVEVDDRVPRLEASARGIARVEYDVSIPILRELRAPLSTSEAIVRAAT